MKTATETQQKQAPLVELQGRVGLAVERLGAERRLRDTETRLDTGRGWLARAKQKRTETRQAKLDTSALHGPDAQFDELEEMRRRDLEAASGVEEATAIVEGRELDVRSARSALKDVPDIDASGVVGELGAESIGLAREIDELRENLIDRCRRYLEVRELAVPLSNGLAPGVPTVRHLRGEPYFIEYIVGAAWHVNPRRAPSVSHHFRDLKLADFEQRLWRNSLTTKEEIENAR